MDLPTLTGTNPVNQNTNLVSQNTSTLSESNSPEYTFLDWLSSVSGFNFYKNLFENKTNYQGFANIMWRDPKTGFSWVDLLKRSRLGKTASDLTGSSEVDIPDELVEYFKQGLDMFDENVNRQYEFNALESAKQREWLELMSNTQYQRAVADLKEAGINPLLAFSGGFHPATVSGGSSASGSLGNSNSLFGSLLSGILGDKKLTMQLLTALAGIFRIFFLNK